jgi:hypothetical protein
MRWQDDAQKFVGNRKRQMFFQSAANSNAPNIKANCTGLQQLEDFAVLPVSPRKETFFTCGHITLSLWQFDPDIDLPDLFTVEKDNPQRPARHRFLSPETLTDVAILGVRRVYLIRLWPRSLTPT